MKGKIILSIGVLVAAGATKALWFPVGVIGASRTAGGQLANSDPAAIAAVVGIGLFTSIPAWITLAAFVILLAIWWPVLRRGYQSLREDI